MRNYFKGIHGLASFIPAKKKKKANLLNHLNWKISWNWKVSDPCQLWNSFVLISLLDVPHVLSSPSLFMQIWKLMAVTPGCVCVYVWVSRSCWRLFTLTCTGSKPKLPLSWSPTANARGKRFSGWLWHLIHTGSQCSIVPGDMICACLDLIRTETLTD